MEVNMSYINLPNILVEELHHFPSGRIVIMTKRDSFWFEPDGTSGKGSYLTPWPDVDCNRLSCCWSGDISNSACHSIGACGCKAINHKRHRGLFTENKPAFFLTECTSKGDKNVES
ncbi:hypothetical protein LCGC14_1598160 [marine sediment metagenome]|uniref:Uncharacterized protein n=1 Tax=marine sediment metagenome TaxID=412755 RepID=A0A0F9ICE1_9ZZZZ